MYYWSLSDLSRAKLIDILLLQISILQQNHKNHKKNLSQIIRLLMSFLCFAFFIYASRRFFREIGNSISIEFQARLNVIAFTISE